MLGLVLWCDGTARRALIWCEDHGDLAWYDASGEGAAAVPVRAGDLVRVGVHVGVDAAPGLRRAWGLRIVARGAHADLPQLLSRDAAG
ncbi:MAG: hypothetical protein ACU0AX_08345 [Roseovarius sp.]|uniref:hypothetical protein n=1 Tax=Roseovarius sp. TaxID=1486281 RepID=UPI004059F440